MLTDTFIKNIKTTSLATLKYKQLFITKEVIAITVKKFEINNVMLKKISLCPLEKIKHNGKDRINFNCRICNAC
jgi:ferredoxin-like protein FixX